MKKALTLFALVMSLSVSAQVDSFIYNAPHSGMDTLIAYRIDAQVTGGSTDSNMVWVSYHYIQTTGDSFLYQPQFIMYDSANFQILPNVDMMNAGLGASGTRLDGVYITAAESILSPDSLRTLYALPVFESVFGPANVTKF